MAGLLKLKRITVTFGGVTAVNKVSFQADQGEFLSLIGPNGAGKTTLLKSVIGSVTPETAEIRLQGLEISSLPTHERVRLGLALTNQIVRPFASMRVVDNVTLAAGHPRFSNVLKTMFSYSRNLERDQALHYLDLVGIAGMKDHPTTGLPLGVLKRLELYN